MKYKIAFGFNILMVMDHVNMATTISSIRMLIMQVIVIKIVSHKVKVNIDGVVIVIKQVLVFNVELTYYHKKRLNVPVNN